jgi:predicted AAA+ superfamily ATPase
VEKDVRQVLQISDVVTFQRFLKLCAARVGNIINYAELARDAAISLNTARSWLSVLEASFIVKILEPYYKNFNKRVTKSPKLYFYDTALVCALLGIKENDVIFHPLKGALFECFVISEMFKYNFNHVLQPQLYFWNDTQGREIDCVVEVNFNTIIPVEMKAGMTVNQDFFKGLEDWEKISGQQDISKYVVYGGNDEYKTQGAQIVPWHSIAPMMNKIYE